MASQQQASNTPIILRDSWQTPDWLFEWARKRFDLCTDLAASAENTKCCDFFDIDDDALSLDWRHPNGTGWCNPPYSSVPPWLEKSWVMAQEGFVTVLLIPTFNGEKYWGKHVFGKASQVINIVGRVAFELPDGKDGGVPQTGNTRGSCLVIYDRSFEGVTQFSHVDRDKMIKEYENEQ